MSIPSKDDISGYVPLAQACQRMRASDSEMRRWIFKGYIRGIQIGSRWYVEHASLEAAVEEKRAEEAIVMARQGAAMARALGHRDDREPGR